MRGLLVRSHTRRTSNRSHAFKRPAPFTRTAVTHAVAHVSANRGQQGGLGDGLCLIGVNRYAGDKAVCVKELGAVLECFLLCLFLGRWGLGGGERYLQVLNDALDRNCMKVLPERVLPRAGSIRFGFAVPRLVSGQPFRGSLNHLGLPLLALRVRVLRVVVGRAYCRVDPAQVREGRCGWRRSACRSSRAASPRRWCRASSLPRLCLTRRHFLGEYVSAISCDPSARTGCLTRSSKLRA